MGPVNMDTSHFAWLPHRWTDAVSLLPAEGYLLKIELPKTGVGQREKNQTQKSKKTKGTQTQAGG